MIPSTNVRAVSLSLRSDMISQWVMRLTCLLYMRMRRVGELDRSGLQVEED